MKDKRHIKSFNEATENLNISDVSDSVIPHLNFLLKELKFDIESSEIKGENDIPIEQALKNLRYLTDYINKNNALIITNIFPITIS